jgi:hypothetical protein
MKMPRIALRDDPWDHIEDFLPGQWSDCGVTAKANRWFVEAGLWLIRMGSPWHD